MIASTVARAATPFTVDSIVVLLGMVSWSNVINNTLGLEGLTAYVPTISYPVGCLKYIFAPALKPPSLSNTPFQSICVVLLFCSLTSIPKAFTASSSSTIVKS